MLVVVAFVLLFMTAGYIGYPVLFGAISTVLDETVYAMKITEGFLTRLRIGLLFGLLLSLPVLFFEILLFSLPALKKKEKVIILTVLVSSLVLFLFGAAFAYKTVLPLSVRFLKSGEFFPDNVMRLLSYNSFITFFFQFLLGFGICFQFPIVLITLLKLGLLSVGGLLAFSKYFVVTAFLLSAIITPPDVVSQILLTVPMIILYFLCIAVGYLLNFGG